MKRILVLACAIVAMTSLWGCEQLAESIATVPSFFVPETTYNGQVFQLARTGTCNYTWSLNSEAAPAAIVLETNGEKAFFKASLPAANPNQSKKVYITARNADRSDISPEENATTITPWTIGVFAYDGDKNETPVDAQKLKVGTKYIMRFIDGSTNKPVASVQKTATKFWTLTYEFANKNLVTAEAQDDNNKMNQIFTAKTAGSTTVSAGFIDKEDTYFQGNGYKASISIKVIN
ncbi:MAG: hypothetical protein IJM35_04050 [Bacteroidales bacterium]|nr:hypothetical protein [Bacteroidales bacterium]